jgi:hypothetical protein
MSIPTTTLSHLLFPATDPTHFVHILSNLMTPEECTNMIASHTNLEPSNLTRGTIRTRETFIDHALARKLWSRMKPYYVGNRIKDEEGYWWVAKGLNPGFRLSKYEKSKCISLLEVRETKRLMTDEQEENSQLILTTDDS